DLEGEDDLLDLPLVGLFGREEEQARELHRQGGEALPLVSRAQVGEGRPGDAPGVDPEMLPEVRVLHRDDGVAENGRYVPERDDDPLLDGELPEHASVRREDLRDDVWLEILERRD